MGSSTFFLEECLRLPDLLVLLELHVIDDEGTAAIDEVEGVEASDTSVVPVLSDRIQVGSIVPMVNQDHDDFTIKFSPASSLNRKMLSRVRANGSL